MIIVGCEKEAMNQMFSRLWCPVVAFKKKQAEPCQWPFVSTLSPASFALSLHVRVSWHIWIEPSQWQCAPKIIWARTAEPRSAQHTAAPCVDTPPANLSAAMTKFSYSEYLSQFRNAGGKISKAQSRLRGERSGEERGSDATELEWVLCCWVEALYARACANRHGKD